MEIEVRVHKGSSAKFTITAGATRKDTEDVIAEKLRSGEGVIWTDDAEGVSVACISGNEIWRPRRRFKLGGDRG